MFFYWYMILGGILLVALILACIGFMCTQNIRDFVPGLIFGVSAVVLSLPITVFCVSFVKIEILSLIPLGVISVIPLYLGLSVICRGFKTGKKWTDLSSCSLVCVGFLGVGFLLSEYPVITDLIFIRLLPMPSIL